jgi:short-subunit dehydrogenase
LPLYGPPKSAIHSFSVALWADLAGNVRVTELSPPYVDTELDKAFKEEMVDKLGGPERRLRQRPWRNICRKSWKGWKLAKERSVWIRRACLADLEDGI